MRYVDVGDDFVNQILEANKLSNQTLNEEMCPKTGKEMTPKDEMYGMGKKKKMKKKVESTDLHECPLCESQLEEPLTVDQIQEHIEFILETINEAEEFEGEEINEEEEELYEEEDELNEEENGDDDEEEDDDDAPRKRRKNEMYNMSPMEKKKKKKMKKGM